MAKPNVVVVKVHRNAAGHSLPFDKIYFFKRDDRPLIPKLFQYALVLPIDEELLTAIYGLKPKEISHLKFRRDDDALKVRTQIGEEDLDGRKHDRKKIQEWWTENIIEAHDFADRVAVVPVLTSKARKKRKPRYLSSKKWYDRQMKGRGRASRQLMKTRGGDSIKGAISELAYLATPLPAPHDKVSPLCTICPRMLLHLQGECIPGQLICYNSLDFNKIDDAIEQNTQEAAE